MRILTFPTCEVRSFGNFVPRHSLENSKSVGFFCCNHLVAMSKLLLRFLRTSIELRSMIRTWSEHSKRSIYIITYDDVLWLIKLIMYSSLRLLFGNYLLFIHYSRTVVWCIILHSARWIYLDHFKEKGAFPDDLCRTLYLHLHHQIISSIHYFKYAVHGISQSANIQNQHYKITQVNILVSKRWSNTE